MIISRYTVTFREKFLHICQLQYVTIQSSMEGKDMKYTTLGIVMHAEYNAECGRTGDY